MELPRDLTRFVAAQAPVYAAVCAELAAGRKRTHWMWFVFPQLAALGRSATAKFYGLEDRAHAQAYIAHPLLGPRLVQCTQLVLGVDAALSANDVFGSPDDLKFASCMTLFERVSTERCFGTALERFCAGRRDPQTLALIGG